MEATPIAAARSKGIEPAPAVLASIDRPLAGMASELPSMLRAAIAVARPAAPAGSAGDLLVGA